MLKPEIILEMRKNPPLRRAIIDANDIYCEKTYYNWLKNNDEKLTTYRNLNLISAYLKMPVESLILNEEASV